MNVRLTRKRIAFALSALALTAVGGVAYAAIPAASNVINGCLKNQNGQLRIVEANAGCGPSETAIAWNKTGPAGTAGAAGAQGPAGAPGATGPQGPVGAAGPPGPTGATGATGPAGAAGPSGSPCLPSNPACVGPRGETGPPGTNGTNGTNGRDGINGTNGVDGAPGAPCLPSNPACVGPAGPAGPAGTDPAVAAFVSAFGTNTNGAGAANGRECTIGEILLTASPARTAGGVPASGQLLSISQNTPLFALLGTTYGGNGVTTFQLPDLRAIAPNQMTYSICTNGIFPAQA